MVPSFNIETVEGKLLNYYIPAQADEVSYQQKHDANTIGINVTELGNQAVREHKDIHKLVVAKMFGVDYDKVTDEQRRIAKTINFKFLYSSGLLVW